MTYGTGMSGTTAGAFGGGLVGSWFGNGGLYGRGGYGAEGISTTILNDGITSIQNAINNANTANIQGQANLGYTALQSSSALQNSTNQGFAGVDSSINQGFMALQNSTNQGFAGLNTEIVGSSKDTVNAIQSCCCKLSSDICNQTNVLSNGQRDIIDNQNRLYTNSLEVKICDLKAENSTLRNEAFVAKNNAEQTNIILHHIASLGK